MWYYSFYGFAISHSQLHKQEISKVKTRVLSCVEKTADCRESAALNYVCASREDESSESVPSAEAQDK